MDICIGYARYYSLVFFFFFFFFCNWRGKDGEKITPLSRIWHCTKSYYKDFQRFSYTLDQYEFDNFLVVVGDNAARHIYPIGSTLKSRLYDTGTQPTAANNRELPVNYIQLIRRYLLRYIESRDFDRKRLYEVLEGIRVEKRENVRGGEEKGRRREHEARQCTGYELIAGFSYRLVDRED